MQNWQDYIDNSYWYVAILIGIVLMSWNLGLVLGVLWIQLL